MSRDVVFDDEAIADLDAIIAYRRDTLFQPPHIIDDFRSALGTLLALIATTPGMGKERREEFGPGIRTFVFKEVYIVYDYNDDIVHVIEFANTAIPLGQRRR